MAQKISNIKKKISLPALIAIITTGVAILAIIIVLALEGIILSKVVIKNETDMNIEDISISFEYAEEDGEVSFPLIDGISINSNDKITKSYKAVNMTGYDTEMSFAITFENKETIWVYDGAFDGNYNGRIEATIYQEDGDYYLKLKAGKGLSNSTISTYCDNEFILYPEEGDWDYKDDFWSDDEYDEEYDDEDFLIDEFVEFEGEDLDDEE